MKAGLREREVFFLLYKYLSVCSSSFVSSRIKFFFFLRLQISFLKFIDVVFRKKKNKFDRIGVFNSFLFFQWVFFNFSSCRFLLFKLFMDFIYRSLNNFESVNFRIISNFLIFLHVCKNIKKFEHFFFLFKDFFFLYDVYGEEFILKFLINLKFFGELKLVKNFISLVYNLNKKGLLKLEIKLILYKVLNKFDLAMLNLNVNNKNFFFQKKKKVLLLMLNLYFFWFFFYLERFVFIFSKFVFLLWVSIVKRFFFDISLAFFNCNILYYDNIELFSFPINLNSFFFNKNMILFTYRFITLQSYLEREFVKKKRKEKIKVTYFYFLKVLKFRSLV